LNYLLNMIKKIAHPQISDKNNKKDISFINPCSLLPASLFPASRSPLPIPRSRSSFAHDYE
jgi:hypothetical protein